jgi:hypothetical protein
VRDPVDVNATSSKIRGNQDLHRSASECCERSLANRLSLSAVECLSANARSLEMTSNPICPVLRPREHQSSWHSVFEDQMLEHRTFVLSGYVIHRLLDRHRGRRNHVGRDFDRISHQRARKSAQWSRESRGEEERLSSSRGLVRDPSHGRQKPLIEHAIDLVENEQLDGRQVDDT